MVLYKNTGDTEVRSWNIRIQKKYMFNICKYEKKNIYLYI